MEETLSLTEILAIFIKKAKVIIIFAIIGAILLGGFQFIKQITATPAVVDETTYQEKFEIYEAKLKLLNTNLDIVQTKIKNQKEYNENSIIMNLNPYDVAVSTTVFQISGIDNLLSLPQYSSEAFTPSYFINTIQTQYEQYLKAMDLKANFPAKYGDISEQYLKEIVSFATNDNNSSLDFANNISGSFSIVVYEESLEMAEEIGKIITDYLLSQKQLVEDSTYPHTLNVVSTTTSKSVVLGIEKIQDEVQSLSDTYLLEQVNLQKQLNELVAPTIATGVKSIKSILVSTVKWLIIGAIFGAVLVCAWIFVVMLFKTKIQSSRRMEQMLKIPFIGSIAKKGDIWNRLANKLINERIWNDETSATAYIEENLKTVLDKEAEVLVVSTLKTKSIDEDIGIISKTALPLCKKVYAVSNAEKNPAMISALGSCKYMVLAERVGKSELEEIQAVIEMAKRKGVEVIGFVAI